MSEMSQAERTAREDAAKADGFGEPARRRAWQAGRDYGRGRERALDKALVGLAEWCAGPLGLERHPAADSNSHDEPINCLLSLGTLRAGIAVLGKARAVLAASQPEVLSEQCPDCVEGHTHDVCDGEPVVEVCGSCHGIGKLDENDAQPDHGPGEPSEDAERPQEPTWRDAIKWLRRSYSVDAADATWFYYAGKIADALEVQLVRDTKQEDERTASDTGLIGDPYSTSDGSDDPTRASAEGLLSQRCPVDAYSGVICDLPPGHTGLHQSGSEEERARRGQLNICRCGHDIRWHRIAGQVGTRMVEAGPCAHMSGSGAACSCSFFYPPSRRNLHSRDTEQVGESNG